MRLKQTGSVREDLSLDLPKHLEERQGRDWKLGRGLIDLIDHTCSIIS